MGRGAVCVGAAAGGGGSPPFCGQKGTKKLFVGLVGWGVGLFAR